MNIRFFMVCLAASSFFMTGCAPKLGGSDYSVAGVGEISQTEEGVIVAKRVVNINASDPSRPGAGAVAGGLAGAVGGSMIGQGHGSTGAALAGGLVGAFAGHAIEQSATSQEGFEYQIKITKSDDVITVSQGAEPNLSVGQPVYVIKSNRSRSRVVAR